MKKTVPVYYKDRDSQVGEAEIDTETGKAVIQLSQSVGRHKMTFDIRDALPPETEWSIGQATK